MWKGNSNKRISFFVFLKKQLADFFHQALLFEPLVDIDEEWLLNAWENTHMLLWSTAPQQVNKGRVECHDGMPHVNEVIIMVLEKVSVTGDNQNGKKLVMK